MEPLGTGLAPALGERALQVFSDLVARRQELDAQSPTNVSLPMTWSSDSETPELGLPCQEEREDGPSRNWVEMLLTLPPTTVLAAEIGELTERAERFLADGAVKPAARLDFVRQRAEQRLAWGQERDAIQAMRPADCWCLGLGGRAPRSFPIAPGDVFTYYDPPCVCPEAEAMAAGLTSARERYRRGLMDARINRVFGQLELRAYQEARMETVIVDPDNAAAWEIMRAWVDLNHPEVFGQSLLLHGGIGTGKTWAAVALMRRRIELGEAALFLVLGDFLDAIKATFGRAADGSQGATTEDVLDAPRRVPLLVLDDLGAEYGTAWAEAQLFGLLNARMNAGLATLFTTNHNVANLHRRAGERIASRVVGMCGGLEGNIVEWSGPDRRLGVTC